eukprot:TRINITY_DN14741_c0_g1_i1.p2 TRINITY_DN14741_c0_g1~~TRINITY_DN14741_c0_g1_i1.p2  ORF type:complete len:259 (+),score=23.89 TRINITY_DN14741_c0_g1_i1:97-777(+)
MAGRGWYYSMPVCREPAVYGPCPKGDWDRGHAGTWDLKRLVDRYSNACYKKFATLPEAVEFFRQHAPRGRGCVQRQHGGGFVRFLYLSARDAAVLARRMAAAATAAVAAAAAAAAAAAVTCGRPPLPTPLPAAAYDDSLHGPGAASPAPERSLAETPCSEDLERDDGAARCDSVAGSLASAAPVPTSPSRSTLPACRSSVAGTITDAASCRHRSAFRAVGHVPGQP